MAVDLLIGLDFYWDFVTGKVRRGESGPAAIHTRFGWVLSGVTPLPRSPNTSHSFLTTHVLKIATSQAPKESLEDILHSFWRLESLGIESMEKTVLEGFVQSNCFKDGRYEVRLPWKEPHPPLPDNYKLSHRCLESLLHRLKHDPAVQQEYDTIIKTQIQQGIVEEVDQSHKPLGEVHYLPHHAVIRKDESTTKLRIVYDASAKSTGCSLNECLHKGPKFDQKILDILLRFRTYPIALTANIEKVFLMISVSEQDRDALRFLWVDNVYSKDPKILTLRFARVVFGLSASPFLLNATLQHHLHQYSSTHPEVVRLLVNSTYVDDIVCVARDEQQAYQLYETSKELFKQGGFNLRKFVTNSKSLQERINTQESSGLTVQELHPPVRANDDTYTKEMFGTMQFIQPGEQRILGVHWDVTTDQLYFRLTDVAWLASELVPTKRNLIATVGKFYDPVGFLSPIVIKFKILLQEICRKNIDWDERLSEELLHCWDALVSELQCSPVMTLDRCFFHDTTSVISSCSLQGFCDASKEAYAVVIYLVMEINHERSVRFVTSKTRVSPLKTQTIPRLELLAALLLARLMNSVTSCLEPELNLTEPLCYTDSEIALYWIRGDTKVWKQFVQRRVMEIREHLPSSCWRHCPGVENPADLPSRGLAPFELANSKLWIHGPKWLTGKDTVSCPETAPMPTECAEELRVAERQQSLGLLVTDDASPGFCPGLIKWWSHKKKKKKNENLVDLNSGP